MFNEFKQRTTLVIVVILGTLLIVKKMGLLFILSTLMIVETLVVLEILSTLMNLETLSNS